MSQDIRATNPVRFSNLRRRPIIDDADLEDPSIEFGDEGPTVIDTADEIERQARLKESLAQELVIARPSAVLAYDAFVDALAPFREKINRRLAGGGNLILAVATPSEGWQARVSKGLVLFVHAAAVECSAPVQTSVCVHTASGGVKTRLGRSIWQTDRIFDQSRASHSVMIVSDDDSLPSHLRLACDAVIDHLDIALTHFQRLIDRNWPGSGVRWPDGVGATIIDPDMFDVAFKRADSAAEFVDLVVAFADAKLIENSATAAATEADAKEKPAKAKSGPEILHPTSPRLGDLHGYGAAQTWAQQLAEDVGMYGRGDLEWNDVDGGALLFGPPGTGKTLFASALAASCGLPFIATSFAAWQGSKGGHLGDVVKAMRDLFAAANNAAPCIVFIDEIDAIPSRDSSREHDDYWRAIVVALLECLDGSSRREGVIVLAACNDPNGLDPALVRSGRLDRRFEIGLPNEEDLARIFSHHLPDLDADVIAPVATALAGMTSGADVARISREARRSARRAKRDLQADDLLSIALPADDRPEELRRLVAVHEAGHAVVAMTFGITPRSLTTVQNGSMNGGVSLEQAADGGRIGDIRRNVQVFLAGRAAEEVIFGQVSSGSGGRGGSDLESATHILARAVGVLGMNGSLVFHDRADGGIVEGQLQRLYAETILICVRRRIEILALADLALERRVLGKKALSDFAVEFGLDGAR